MSEPHRIPAEGPATVRSPYVHRVTAGPAAAADWTRSQVIATNLRGIRGRATPRIRAAVREKSWLIFEIILPLLSTSAFGLVYRALGAPEAYIGFAVLGGAMSAFWLNVIWAMGTQLYWDRGEGNLEIYFTAPVSLMSVLIGMAVGGLYMSGLRAVIIITIGSVLFGVQYQVDQWLLLLGVFALTLVALYGLGMLLASLFLMWGREAWHIAQLLTEPIYFLGGLYAPVRVLGPIAGLVVGVLPLATGLDAIRQLTFPEAASLGVLTPATEALVLVGLSVAFLLAARAALAFLEMKARAEGRLVARWQ